ncbi:ran GTPase-activating protein 1 [Microplitis demolitor]|uniref:ran GTPase-activating protein 1 n=1 Tax=Microplitis demolitor TaxID=69319 RepID=UPI0004CD86E1|nr:ran GTPase-activating protein 1 [Microplitis demolitor]
MTSFSFGELQHQLEASTTNNQTGVSFSGKSLKLNSEQDAEEVCEEIKKCSRLDYLDLEGNTLGPDAAKAISETLASHGGALKRALWKDMFTGRMKTEIPKALEYLGNGLNTAGAHLVELDLSDNAFGPIGVQGLAALLSSSTCYTLQELRLNNNGLGISGGKMLAKALLDCHANSSREAKPLALRVFIAGRNRLENEGATALAGVFAKLGTLEEVVMPQNGIYHPGVSALATGLSANPGLKILNLNDNTVGPKGAQALADVLSNFPALETLNLGDCLLKSKGAMVIANALGARDSHTSLVELNLAFNEIKTRAVDTLARATIDKTQLTSLQLDGNAFGEAGRNSLRESLKNYDRIDSLEPLEEDATDDEESGDDESQSEGEDEDTEKEGSENDDKGVENGHAKVNTVNNIQMSTLPKAKKPVDVKEFLKEPTGENFLLLEGDKAAKLLDHVKSIVKENNAQDHLQYIDELLPVIMKVSALCGSGYGDIRVEAEQLTDKLYSHLFDYATTNQQMSYVNNNLFVVLGLIKGENKNTNKADWNLEGCFKALEKVSQQDYFPPLTRATLKLLIERSFPTKSKTYDPCYDVKMSLKTILDRLQNT